MLVAGRVAIQRLAQRQLARLLVDSKLRAQQGRLVVHRILEIAAGGR